MFAGEFGSLAFGTPTKVTPIPARQDWNTPIAVNSAVVGFCLANGTVVPLRANPPLPFAPPAGSSARGS